MGHSKKRKYPSIEEVLDRPWCYYCERDFDDLKVLMSHQKAKHYKCDKCNRRLNTAGGLNVHMSQVHKEELKRVENALESRSGLEVEIFGMEGIPEDILREHRERKSQEYWENARERERLTGNVVTGASGNHVPGKRAKLPPMEDIEAMLSSFLESKKLGLIPNALHTNGAPHPPGPAVTPQFSSPAPPAPGLPHPASVPAVASLAVPEADQASATPETQRPESAAQPAEKKSKKSKDKSRLVFSSEDMTPEEVLLSLPQFLFDPALREQDGAVQAPILGATDQVSTEDVGMEE